jgi:phosphoribosylglycinamide formyltransferase-1
MSNKKKIRIGVLASGGGSNLQSIIDSTLTNRLNAEVTVVISNNRDSGAIQRAIRHGIDHLYLSKVTEGTEEALDDHICRELTDRGIDIVALAGYMKKVGPRVLEKYKGRILNIHPALLPKFGGKGLYGIHVHEAVIKAGEKESGASVHIVDEEYDRGPVLGSVRVPVLPEDTPETLQKRVLEKEHELYPFILEQLVSKLANENL